jgi:hypothetical protein
MSSGDVSKAPARTRRDRGSDADEGAKLPTKGARRRESAAPAPDSGDSGVHASAHGHSSAEHRPPERIAPSREEYGDISIEGREEEEESGTISPEEIAQETERWAPRTIKDTVIEIEKICRVCGMNLKGHRRYKDEKGYICRDCDRDERLRRIPCAECGKPVPPEALRPWGPISICTRCWADHESDPKLRIKRKVSSRPWEELEKKTVLAITALMVLAIFVLFIISLFR